MVSAHLSQGQLPSVNIYFCHWRMLYKTDSCLPSQAEWVSLTWRENFLHFLRDLEVIVSRTKTCTASLQFNSSQRVTALLIALILQQDRSYPPGVAVDQNLKGKIKAQWRRELAEEASMQTIYMRGSQCRCNVSWNVAVRSVH